MADLIETLARAMFPTILKWDDADPYVRAPYLRAATACAAAHEAWLQAAGMTVVKVEAIRKLIAFMDDAMDGHRFDEGVYEPGVTDLELAPDGSLMLSDLRAMLSACGVKEKEEAV